MSLAGRRTEIAAVLSTATDVKGYAYRPTTPRPGDAWPLLGKLERADGMAFYVTWRVLVFLPQDEQGASEWMDSHYEDIVEVLEPVGFVDSVEPALVNANGTDQLAMQITMRGE